MKTKSYPIRWRFIPFNCLILSRATNIVYMLNLAQAPIEETGAGHAAVQFIYTCYHQPRKLSNWQQSSRRRNFHAMSKAPFCVIVSDLE